MASQGVAIVLMEHVGEGKVGVMPLFVAITPDQAGPRHGSAKVVAIPNPIHHAHG